jgi:ribosome biogenesis protein UTP30
VIGLDKLKKKYNTFETKRQLLAEYDIFLGDDRIVSELPRILGKVFLSHKAKRPIPVSLTMQLPKDKDGKRKRIVRKPEEIAKEIESALTATYVHLSPTATTSIRVGKLSQTPAQLKENVEAVVAKLTEKFVPQGWKNVRGLHIKGPTTQALPIWLADELWTDETRVLEEAYKPTIRKGESKSASDKKRKWDEWAEEMMDDDDLAELKAKQKQNKRSRSRKDGEEQTMSTISRENRKKLKQEALEAVKTPLVAG